LRIAGGLAGTWENSFSELGQNAGFFKKHGLVLEIFYTQGAGETQQAVISGSADIGTGVGTFNTFGAFAKGAPIRVIAATHTGANDAEVAHIITFVALLDHEVVAPSLRRASGKMQMPGAIPGQYARDLDDYFTDIATNKELDCDTRMRAAFEHGTLNGLKVGHRYSFLFQLHSASKLAMKAYRWSGRRVAPGTSQIQ
jgi:NMT1/THI5 like